MFQSHVPREGTDNIRDRVRQRCRGDGDAVEVYYDHYTCVLAWAPRQGDSGVELAVVLSCDAESSGSEGNS